jgi:hypothetical protein
MLQFHKRSFAMRYQGKQRTAAPGPRPRDQDLPTSGYAVIVDGHSKADFVFSDQALKAAKDLKKRFPMLQVMVYDAERKRSEKIELTAV